MANMDKVTNPTSRRAGRPVEHPMPKPIPDTAENIARAVLRSRPKKRDEWKYLKAAKKRG